MKIVQFQGGLGNQLFQYVFYLHLRKKYPKQKFYGFYTHMALRAHNGLEIQKWFDVQLPKNSTKTDLISNLLFFINKLFWKMKKPLPFTDNDRYRRNNALFYSGFWQDKEYILEVGAPKFRKDLNIGKDNEALLRLMAQSNSVAVHVRRGDYLAPEVQYIYGDICTLDYYKKAIDYIAKNVENPTFFFFSDDADYVKENFKNLNKVVSTCNTGSRSFFDLYLMAHCRNMIIANSTFSTWAAYLNENHPLVVCPSKYRNDRPSPPVTFDEWKKI